MMFLPNSIITFERIDSSPFDFKIPLKYLCRDMVRWPLLEIGHAFLDAVE